MSCPAFGHVGAGGDSCPAQALLLTPGSPTAWIYGTAVRAGGGLGVRLSLSSTLQIEDSSVLANPRPPPRVYQIAEGGDYALGLPSHVRLLPSEMLR